MRASTGGDSSTEGGACIGLRPFGRGDKESWSMCADWRSEKEIASTKRKNRSGMLRIGGKSQCGQ